MTARRVGKDAVRVRRVVNEASPPEDPSVVRRHEQRVGIIVLAGRARHLSDDLDGVSRHEPLAGGEVDPLRAHRTKKANAVCGGATGKDERVVSVRARIGGHEARRGRGAGRRVQRVEGSRCSLLRAERETTELRMRERGRVQRTADCDEREVLVQQDLRITLDDVDATDSLPQDDDHAVFA